MRQQVVGTAELMNAALLPLAPMTLRAASGFVRCPRHTFHARNSDGWGEL